MSRLTAYMIDNRLYRSDDKSQTITNCIENTSVIKIIKMINCSVIRYNIFCLN